VSVPAVNDVAGMNGTPVVNQALEPASVRNGGPAVQKDYSSALDFESMLVQQLSQSLTENSETAETGTENETEGGEAANPELSSMLPQALTESVMNHGGLGLAPQLMAALGAGGGLGQAGATQVGAAPVSATRGSAAQGSASQAELSPTGGVAA
jgi:hypothetical protein